MNPRAAEPSIPACLALVLAGVLHLSGCSNGGPDGTATAISPEEARIRQQKAAELYHASEVEPPVRKIDLLRKLVDYYPEYERASRAHFDLVFYLIDQRNDHPDEALDAAVVYGERHPEDLFVSEAFRLHDSDSGTRGRKEHRKKVQAAWWAWLERAMKRVAAKDVETRARWHLECGDCLRRSRRPEEAVKWLSEAAGSDIPAKDVHLSILVLWATALGEDLGRKPEAIAVWERALVLARAGVRGEKPETIESRIAALK